MHDQPKIEPFEASALFGDGRASREPPDGTVARGLLKADQHLYFGKEPADPHAPAGATKPVAVFPFPVQRELLERGRERFDIYCSPCHARTGEGDGMIVRRGFRRPPSLHTAELRAAPVGHLFDVVTNGLGAMPAHAAQIPVLDRWAIVAFVRALQLSQRATLDDVPTSERARLVAEHRGETK